MVDDFSSALLYLASPLPGFLVFIGVLSGIIVGAIPGLSGGMIIALVLPITFFFSPQNAVALLVAMYVGSVSGGLITATLLRIPGAPSNVMTTLDGYPMAARGEPRKALGLGIYASFVGGVVSWFALFYLTEPLSVLATRFGPFDYFGLTLLAMVLIVTVSKGTMLKGLISGALGMLVAIPGIDPSSGRLRLTGDFTWLDSGFKLLPVLVGIFAVSQLLSMVAQKKDATTLIETGNGPVFLSLASLRPHVGNLIRSSVVGTGIGILPGIGASIGSVVSYSVAKGLSRQPEKFGSGAEEGVVASETANNSTVGGALIPLIAIGIPGSIVDAILIGALAAHALQPGPLLFVENVGVVWTIIATCLVANILMFVIMIFISGPISKLTRTPTYLLVPVIAAFCFVGVYAGSNSMSDVWIMLGFGILGYVMDKTGFPLAPFIIGLVIAPITEASLRSGLMASGGDFLAMFQRPISLICILLAVGMLVWPLVSSFIVRSSGSTLSGGVD